MLWLVMAVLSAFFAGLTAILAKCGIKHTDSDVATAVRTLVVLIFSWIMVLIVGSLPTLSSIAPRSLLFLVLSGLATGASWLCYFKALSLGDVNKVVPIDKSSTILSVLFAIVCFSETAHLAVKLIFILLSGLATGASWLCYYYAIQNGIVSVVVPIDKLSLVVTVAFSYVFFHEKLSKKAFLGLCLMVIGTLAMAIWS
ncbi:MAG: EamA family transporter [Butyricicoccus pullicaecorum]|nr:EamA family transporter [Butyricicoccus pullicaecorum]